MKKAFFLLLSSLLLACSAQKNGHPHQPSASVQSEINFRKPSSYLQSFIDNDSLGYQVIEHKNFKIYAREGSYTSQNTLLIKAQLDRAMQRVFEVLQIDSYSYGIHLFAVDSESEMKELMGRPIKGGTALGHDLIFFVFSERVRPYFKHELFHLLAFETWGQPASRLLDEGGATYCDNYCFYENPMYAINAGFDSLDKWMEMKDLIENFNKKAAGNDVVAYLQSAGYFKYLYETYGVKKMKNLWQRGFDDFEDIYGFGLEEFEDRWMKVIRQTKVPKGFDYQMLLREGCG